MGGFAQIADNLRKINLNKIFQEVFSESNIQKWIIETIQKRIYNTGVDGAGNQLQTDKATSGFYSDRTKDIKSYFGQKYSNVTLKDSGEFYNSMKIMLNNIGFSTDANFEKENGNMYKNFTQSYGSQAEFSANVMSLNDNELNDLLINKAIPMIGEKIVKQI